MRHSLTCMRQLHAFGHGMRLSRPRVERESLARVRVIPASKSHDHVGCNTDLGISTVCYSSSINCSHRLPVRSTTRRRSLLPTPHSTSSVCVMHFALPGHERKSAFKSRHRLYRHQCKAYQHIRPWNLQSSSSSAYRCTNSS